MNVLAVHWQAFAIVFLLWAHLYQRFLLYMARERKRNFKKQCRILLAERDDKIPWKIFKNVCIRTKL